MTPGLYGPGIEQQGLLSEQFRADPEQHPA